MTLTTAELRKICDAATPDKFIATFNPSRVRAMLDEIDALTARAKAAEALVREAGEALRPFAERVKRADKAAISNGFAPSFDEYPVDWSFPFSTLRRAAAFLAKIQPKDATDE